MTPADYRAKWGLPDSYPMTAPDCAARRSALASQPRYRRHLEGDLLALADKWD
jgi:predicted transcriptional regulator